MSTCARSRPETRSGRKAAVIHEGVPCFPPPRTEPTNGLATGAAGTSRWCGRGPAGFTEFDEFWEFVSGPLHASGFGPNRLDATFGPVVEFVKAPPAPNTPPLDGFQHLGEVEVAPGGATMRVSLRDRAGAQLWSTTLEAAR